MNLGSLRPGAVVSFSAGQSDPTQLVGRVSREPASDPLTSIATELPSLAAWLGAQPVVIQAYPAQLAAFPSAIFVDSYLRPANVMRGLRLAAELEVGAVLLAQPLVAAHLLMQRIADAPRWPRRLLLVMGGYACPCSLEDLLIELGNSGQCEVRALHAYGCAEVAPAMLIGMRDESGQVLYRRRFGTLQVQGPDGRLLLGDGNQLVATGDHLLPCGDGYRVLPGSERQAAAVTSELSRWGSAEWRRRTGYLHCSPAGLTLQLRAGIVPGTPDEMEHHEFCRVHGMTWLDKPRWS